MNKKITISNYLLLILICSITVVLTLYINQWIKTIRQNKLSVSPLSTNVSEVNIDELSVTLNESNNVILIISYTGKENIYQSEKKLLKYIKKTELNEYVIYVNVTEYLENNKYKNIIKSELNIDVDSLPTLLYVKNGKVIEKIELEDKVIQDSDIELILEKYDFH